MENKAIIRKEYKNKRLMLAKANVDYSSELICNKILDLDIYKKSTVILAYSSIQNEIDLTTVINNAIASKKSVFLPKVEDEIINFYKINDLNSLQAGSYNINEPKATNIYRNQTAIMLVPGIVFNSNGGRIGFGKGYYDRFLNKNNNIYKIGIAYDWQICDSWQQDEFDISMNMIITDKKEVYIND